jgi:hypothetical protein
MISRPFQLSLLINMESPEDVFTEVVTIALMMFPRFDTGSLKNRFQDAWRLFGGQYPGYRACDTMYHDFKHTTDTFLAMMRIIHGAAILNPRPSEHNVFLALISALFHDSGYILRKGEKGPGARYTQIHIQRSIAFLKPYLLSEGFSRTDADFCTNIVDCTGLDVKIDAIHFASEENEFFCKVLGTADLLGQLADRTYLEKLPFLYDEFHIASIKGLGSELDFFRNTIHFAAMTKKRFQDELGGVNRYMRPHFQTRWGIDEDLYQHAVDKSIAYLEQILKHHPDDIRRCLRRAGIVHNR